MVREAMESGYMQSEAPAATDHPTFFAVPQGGYTTLAYDPPYANELDDQLARHLVAYLVPAASLDYRARLWAGFTYCRFDFVIDLGTRRIALDYRDTPENLETELVEDNDALALGTAAVDAVIRIRREDLERSLYDCFHIIAKWEPDLFTPYGRRVFASRAGAEARAVFPAAEAEIATVVYQNEEDVLVLEDGSEEITWPNDEAPRQQLIVRRLARELPDAWMRHFERARLVYGQFALSQTLSHHPA